MSLSWSIPIEELKQRIYDYLEYMVDQPVSPHDFYGRFDLSTPLTTIQTAFQELEEEGLVRKAIKEDGEEAYLRTIRIISHYKNEKQPAYPLSNDPTRDESRGIGGLMRRPQIQLEELNLSISPTPIDGMSLHNGGSPELPERVAITLEVPKRFLEEFKARIEDHYEDLAEAIRSGMALTFRLRSSSPST